MFYASLPLFWRRSAYLIRVLACSCCMALIEWSLQALPILLRLYREHWLFYYHPLYLDENRALFDDDLWGKWEDLQWQVGTIDYMLLRFIE